MTTPATMNEISILASPARFVISYQHGTPVIGEAQDSLIGTAELTRSDVRIDKYHAMSIFSNSSLVPNFRDRPDHIYTGRDLITMLLQHKNYLINFSRKPNIYNPELAEFIDFHPDDIHVVIERGVFMSGILDKASIGEGKPGSIFHIIHNEYGSRAALDMSFDIQQMAINYLKYHGYSIGLRDLILNQMTKQQIREIESGIVESSILISQDLDKGLITPPLGKTTKEYFEDLQMNELNPGDMLVKPVFTSIDFYNNGFAKMVLAGSKGSAPNLISSVSNIGQLQIDGQRMRENFGGRTLSYFTRYDSNPESRGLVPDSYITGTKLPATVFNSMEARVALIGIALGTAVSGEQNRISVKNLEDQIINNFRQTSKGLDIVQFIYGDDGSDPRFGEQVHIPTVAKDLSDAEFEKRFRSSAKSFSGFNNKAVQELLDSEFEDMKKDRKEYQRLFIKIERMTNRMYQNHIRIPVNVKRILDNVVYRYRDEKIDRRQNPAEMVGAVQQLCRNLPYLLMNEIQERKQSPVPEYMYAATTMICVVIRSYLNMATLARLRVNMDMLQLAIDQIRQTYRRALVAYGTCIGIIAAQSTSEPMTQLALDSKHRAGLGGGKVKGMSAIKEILGVRSTKDMRNPTMIIPLKPEFAHDKEKAQEIANMIEMMPLRRFLLNVKTFFEEYGKPSHPDFMHESKQIAQFEKYNKGVKRPADLSKWVIRFALNKPELILKQMTVEDIYHAIRKTFPSTFSVYTSENEENLFIRVYIRQVMFKKKGEITKDQIAQVRDRIINIVIRGVEGIKAANVHPINQHLLQPDGTIERKRIYNISTMGTNMDAIIDNPFVDTYSVQSNSVDETAELLGVGAANRKVVNELRDQISTSEKHYHNIADAMTFPGTVTSITRHGVAKRDYNRPMLRMSESSPVAALEEAAANNMYDPMAGPSGQIMLGGIPRVGSNYNNVVINEKMIAENIQTMDSLIEDL